MYPVWAPLLVLLGLVLLEIFGFAWMGGLIGPLLTVLLVVATAAGGLWIIRLQGAGQLSRIQRAMDDGQLPALELVSAALLPVAAITLLFPGFFTDILGLLLLVPRLREALARKIVQRFARHVHSRPTDDGSGNPRVIEGEFRRESPDRLRDQDR